MEQMDNRTVHMLPKDCESKAEEVATVIGQLDESAHKEVLAFAYGVKLGASLADQKQVT